MKTRKEFIKHTIKILEDLIKNHSYMEWDNPEGNRVVHIDDIKEKIKELKSQGVYSGQFFINNRK